MSCICNIAFDDVRAWTITSAPWFQRGRTRHRVTCHLISFKVKFFTLEKLQGRRETRCPDTSACPVRFACPPIPSDDPKPLDMTTLPLVAERHWRSLRFDMQRGHHTTQNYTQLSNSRIWHGISATMISA